MCLRNSLLLILATVALASGQVERGAADYPARVELGDATLAAEKLGPAVPSQQGSLYTDGYLVIEAAMFSKNRRNVSIRHEQFRLRINGAKTLVSPDTPGAVAASIKYPDWEQRRHVEVGTGMGDATVILGRPYPTERFPGDRRPTVGTVPNPVPRTPTAVDRAPDATPIEETVARAALQEGDIALPTRGCLYFRFKGKLKSIRKLELIYARPLGEAVLRIP